MKITPSGVFQGPVDLISSILTYHVTSRICVSLQDLSEYQRGREMRRATIARFIMVNDLSHITPTTPAQDDMPGMIWWPLIPDEVTLRELARRRPDMKLQVAMTCIEANYERLWKELEPEPSQQLWHIAQRNWVYGGQPFRSSYTDYMERREAEIQGGSEERYDHFCADTDGHQLCDEAAVVIKEPTSTYLQERIDFPMTSEAVIIVLLRYLAGKRSRVGTIHVLE
jgi:hypothetical protein